MTTTPSEIQLVPADCKMVIYVDLGVIPTNKIFMNLDAISNQLKQRYGDNIIVLPSTWAAQVLHVKPNDRVIFTVDIGDLPVNKASKLVAEIASRIKPSYPDNGITVMSNKNEIKVEVKSDEH